MNAVTVSHFGINACAKLQQQQKNVHEHVTEKHKGIIDQCTVGKTAVWSCVTDRSMYCLTNSAVNRVCVFVCVGFYGVRVAWENA